MIIRSGRWVYALREEDAHNYVEHRRNEKDASSPNRLDEGFMAFLGYTDHHAIGKWVVEDSVERLAEAFEGIEQLVEDGRIPLAKYSPKEDLFSDPLPSDPPIRCVYADNRKKDSVLFHMEGLGLRPHEFRYEWETRRDWEPGGRLDRRMQEQRMRYLLELGSTSGK